MKVRKLSLGIYRQSVLKMPLLPSPEMGRLHEGIVALFKRVGRKAEQLNPNIFYGVLFGVVLAFILWLIYDTVTMPTERESWSTGQKTVIDWRGNIMTNYKGRSEHEWYP